MLKRIKLDYLDEHGYINLRCAWAISCPSNLKPLDPSLSQNQSPAASSKHETTPQIKAAFEELFPGEPAPKDVGSVPCCTQFAVSRWKLHQRPKSDYVRYRDWLVNTPLSDEISAQILDYSWPSKRFLFSVYYLFIFT